MLLLVFLLVVLIGVGGKVYMNKRAEQKEAEKIEVERMSVEALKKTFKDIKSVEFEKSGYNKTTGSYTMIVKMTSKNKESVKFDFKFTTNHPNEIGGWGVKDKENVQKKGVTKSEVEVTFTNGSEEEI